MRMSSNVRAWIAAGAAVLALGAAFSTGCGGDNGNTQDAGNDVTTNACGNGSTLCGGTCVSTQNDNANCGACGTACTSGQVCSQGKCAASCGGGTKLCGSTCADTKNDPQNCGGCGTKCGAGEVCSNGACGSTCSSGQTFCGGDGGSPYCANTKTDNANCGGCGTTCGAGQVCNDGSCTNSCGGDDAGTDTLCTPEAGAPYCANTKTDNANCGACGVTCGSGKICQNGACANACAASDGGVETLCTPDGGPAYCASTQTDNANCGTCGNVCGLGAKCIGGTCSALNATLLIVYSSLYEADVYSQLTGTKDFSVIDQFDGSTATPTLADLSKYTMVLVYSDDPFSDATTLGNNLADYWDNGGTVVPAVFSNVKGYALAGRWITDGYDLIDPAGADDSPSETLPLVIIDTTSPLVSGVTTLTASAGFQSGGSVVNGAVTVAEWGSGTPLIVTGTKNNRRHVELNFYPPSKAARTDFWTGDGTKILVNALFF